VLDIIMPDMDGLIVLDFIRRVDAKIPVVMVTALTSEGLAKKVAGDPAVSFFQKGLGMDRFLEIVNRMLALGSRANS